MAEEEEEEEEEEKEKTSRRCSSTRQAEAISLVSSAARPVGITTTTMAGATRIRSEEDER